MSSQDILNELIKSGRLGHAYIFFGPQKEKMAQAAIKFAKALNCLKQDEGFKSCDTCISCVKIGHFNHPDIAHIELEENSRQIKIEQIRNLQRQAHLKPIEAKKKVFIIYDAGAMNEEASNCLLKTLEEPPKDVIIILIGPGLTLFSPTIISRCQVIRFAQTKDDRNQPDENIAFIDEFLAAENPFSCEGLEFVKRPKAEQLKTVDLLLSYFRDMLVYKFLQDGSYIMNLNKLADISSMSERYAAEDILALMKEFLKSKDLLQSNVNSKLVADGILGNLVRLKGQYS